MYSHTFITNHAVILYETTQWCGTEPGVKTTPNINICHIYDRRLDNGSYICMYIVGKKTGRRKTYQHFSSGRPDTKISGVSYFLSSSVAFRIVYSVYIYFYKSGKIIIRKRGFFSKELSPGSSGSPSSQLGLCFCSGPWFSFQELCS